MREPIHEPTPQELRQTARGAEPLRYTGPVRANEAVPYQPSGLVAWAPTWGGMFVSLGILVLLGSLGIAIGVGTGAGVWGAISVIIGFLVGGWFTGRTLDMVDSLVAAVHGTLMWAVTLVFTFVFAILTAFLGVNALANVARTAIIANLIGPLGSAVGAPTAAAATGPAVSGWGTFLILLLSIAAAIVGALIGNQRRIPGPIQR